MTEQPVESMSEQRWPGNASPGGSSAAGAESSAAGRAVGPDEVRLRSAQRVSPPRLAPPAKVLPLPVYPAAPMPVRPLAELRPAPVVTEARPYDLAQANILLRRSITAAAKLQLAKEAAEEAEQALKQKLAVEELAQVESTEAERELLEFLRSAAEQ